MIKDESLKNVELSEELEELLESCPDYIIAHNEEDLVDL